MSIGYNNIIFVSNSCDDAGGCGGVCVGVVVVVYCMIFKNGGGSLCFTYKGWMRAVRNATENVVENVILISKKP